MASKTIYFLVHDKLEKAQFTENDNQEDIKDLFRSAAGATSRDIVKLYNSSSALVSINQYIPANSPDSPYRLEIVACCPKYVSKFMTSDGKNTLIDLESRLNLLEESVYSLVKVEAGKREMNQSQPQWLSCLSEQIDSISRRLQQLEVCDVLKQDYLASVTYNQEAQFRSSFDVESTIICNTGSSLHRSMLKKTSDRDIQSLWNQFQTLCNCESNNNLKSSLREGNFNNWAYSDAELMFLIRQMFLDQDLHTIFSIRLSVLERWIMTVYRYYNNVPFHNFKHAFMVVQMAYTLINVEGLSSHLTDLERLIILFAALSHDLDHPGFNNAYQINAGTTLALRYNDQSPLENHHCSVAFWILTDQRCDILQGLTPSQRKTLRETAIKCILATDMAKHNDIVSEFRQCIGQFDWDSSHHRNLLMLILIKVADISNEARPTTVAGAWLDVLLEEFFQQSDTEKLEGLPVAPFMDRDKVTRSSSQIGFIQYVMMPLLEALVQLVPSLEPILLGPVRSQLEYYETSSLSPALIAKNGVTSSSSTTPASRKSSTGSKADQ